MKTITLGLFFIVCSHYGTAQQGNISIQQDEKIIELVELYKSTNEKSGYYSIQVFFGSLQGAKRAKNNVDTDFPGWSSTIKFETPSYRVRVGRFKDKLVAERKFIEVRKKYPQAMLLNPKRN